MPDPPNATFVHFVLAPSFLQELTMNDCEWSIMHWPFMRVPVSLANFWTETAFHSWMLCGHHFLAPVFWAGEPGVGLDSMLLGGKLHSWESQLPYMGSGPVLFASPPFLLVLMQLLPQTFYYKTSIQLVSTYYVTILDSYFMKYFKYYFSYSYFYLYFKVPLNIINEWFYILWIFSALVSKYKLYIVECIFIFSFVYEVFTFRFFSNLENNFFVFGSNKVEIFFM